MRKLIPLLLLSISSVFLATEAFASEWISAQNGGRGRDPVRASYVENDFYYVCAGRTPNGFQAGHLGHNQSICYVAWGQSYLQFSYLVLQGDDSVAWLGKDMVSQDQVIQLDPENGRPTAICMASNGLPGKVVDVYFHREGLSGVCYTSWGDRDYAHYDFRVLVRR